MRIAIVTNQFPSRVSTFFARDVRALLEAGVAVEIFAIHPHDATLWQFVPELLDAGRLSRDRVHHLNAVGAGLRTLADLPRSGFRLLHDSWDVVSSAIRFGPRCGLKSAYVIPKAAAWAAQGALDKFDHILAYWGNYAATCAWMMHRLADVPFSMFLHAGIDLYRDQAFLPEKLEAAESVFVVCEFNRRYIRQHWPGVYERIESKIHLHHLGLDLENFAYARTGREQNRILGVGSFTARKGFHHLVSAIHKVAQRGRIVSLELIGDGEDRQQLETQARSLGIADRVVFRGWLRSDDVQAAMRRATMLVHPSDGLGDAVPTVIKECMALGTPVIASDIAGTPELLDGGRCGTLVASGDVDALVGAIVSFLDNESLREETARIARRRAEQLFNMWDNGTRLANLLAGSARLVPIAEAQGA